MSVQAENIKNATAMEVPRRTAYRTWWADALRRLASNKLALAGGILVLLMIVIAIFAPFIAPYSPTKQDTAASLQAPSLSHLMGTDILGRDTFSRLIYGARISLAVGIFAQFIILLIGLPIGAIAGLAGGRVDTILMRCTDIMYAFPDLLLIILFQLLFGGGIFMIFLAIGLVSWTNIARLMRGQILSLKEQDFVKASQAMGARNSHIILRHLLPNSLGPIIVVVTFGVPRAIFAEAALSYIGIGIKPPTPSWGTMIQDGTQAIFASPYPILFPALALALLMMSFSFLGDGLRDALDPRMRR
jgi:oligopeptide transport system permease protein